MRGRLRLWTVGIGTALVLALPASAASQSVERVRLAALTPPAAVPADISLDLTSPPMYVRGSATNREGSWVGPHYQARGDSSLGGNVTVRWSVGFDATSHTAKAAAIGGPKRDWRYLRKDPIGIPHVVGKRLIGTINGFAYITHGVDAFDASYEAVLAVPVARAAFAVLNFDFDDPPSDTAPDGSSYVVAGLEPPSVWHRGQVFWTLSGVQLVGSLPPTRVRVHVSKHTELRGDVIDVFRNPVARAQVLLERRGTSGWAPVKKARTTYQGTYTFRRMRPGVYRTEVAVGDASARSRSIRIRRIRR